jgi:small neutral amino acid transporter SnatA (MarC family)
MLSSLSQDVRYVLRTLRRSPGFAAAAIAPIALGIGINTGVFSILNNVMYRPLPAPEPTDVPRRSEEVAEEHWKALAVLPIAIPGAVGAGTINTVVIQATTFKSPGDLAIITAVCSGTALIMEFRLSGPIARRLGPIGINIVTRVMASW